MVYGVVDGAKGCKNATTSYLICIAARSTGRFPCESFTAGSAFRRIRSFTKSSDPQYAAACKHVSPAGRLKFGDTPALMRPTMG